MDRKYKIAAINWFGLLWTFIFYAAINWVGLIWAGIQIAAINWVNLMWDFLFELIWALFVGLIWTLAFWAAGQINENKKVSNNSSHISPKGRK